MSEDRLVRVSPRHSVRLAREYVDLVDRAPRNDYVVRTILRREANGLPLMTAEILIAGGETRERYPLAATYPLHFKKTYAPARLHGDPAAEFDHQTLASRLIRVLPPIGHTPDVYRSCLVPGRPYQRLSPFGLEPEDSNLRAAHALPLESAAGLFRLCEEALESLQTLHAGGLAHGDAELHNLVVCPSPLELVLIDFESAVRKETLDAEGWNARTRADLVPLLREAVFLQCSLGRQEGALADLSLSRIGELFKAPARFRHAIEEHADLE